MKMLFLGDTHFPFENKAAIKWAIKLAQEMKPDVIVQLGDLTDQFSFSRYPRAHKMDPADELKKGVEGAQKMWAALPKNCRRIQILGNHDDRMQKQALKAMPELISVVEDALDDMYTFEGVETIKEFEFELEGIMVQHGHRAKLGDHAKYNQCSTVVGHSHHGGVVYLRNRDGVYWELNAGFLGDINTTAFGYVSQKKVNTTTLGVGYVDELGPRFIPYPPESK